MKGKKYLIDYYIEEYDQYDQKWIDEGELEKAINELWELGMDVRILGIEKE